MAIFVDVRVMVSRLRIYIRPDDVCSAIHLRSDEHTNEKRKERNSDS
jgi:hypothetical protein